jgi:hypothetical protein
MRNHDPEGTRYASVRDEFREVEILKSLAVKTGLSVATIVEMRAADPTLRSLFDDFGHLKSRTELRSLEAARAAPPRKSPEQRQLELLDYRWPKKKLTPQQCQLELLKEKAKWFNEFS